MPDTAENFAILFSGGGDPLNNYSRYYNSLKGMYEVLIDQRGLAPENIVVLYADAGSDQPGFDQNHSADDPDSLRRLFVGAGVDSSLIDAFIEYKQRPWRLTEAEYKDVLRAVGGINASQDIVHVDVDGVPDGSGYVAHDVAILSRSDLSFARDRGSTVLSATSENLQAVLTDSTASGGLLNRVDSSDHAFLWTFDHGSFNGNTKPGGFADRSAGNRASLVGWGQQPLMPVQDVAGWLKPLLSQSGSSTLAFAQCYSGGLVDALEPQLGSLPEAYAMAATNGFEDSYASNFADGITLSLAQSNPLARDLFAQAKASDISAFQGDYAPNGGDPISGKEHPWAYPGDGGDFAVFAGDSAPHPLEGQGVAVIGNGDWADTDSENSVQLTLAEDSSLDVHQALVAAGAISDESTITGVRLADRGRLALDADQRLQYSPLADVHGTDRLGLEFEGPDGVGRLEVELAIQAVNDAPYAGDDRVVVARDSHGTRFSVDPVTGFLGDFDIDGDDLSIKDFTNPNHGTLQFLGGNAFVYTPDSDFKGEDRFFYQLSDGAASSVAEVTLDVGGSVLDQRDDDGAYTVASTVFDDVLHPIRRRNGKLISDQSSSRWDVVDAAHLDDRYVLLLEGEGRREGLFRVWDSATTGGLIKRRGWWGGDRLERSGYEGIFQRDFDGDGQILAAW